MKKILLSIIVVALTVPAFATHLMGGQITARQLSGFQYEITMTLYRDTLGVPIANPDVINYHGLDSIAFDSSRWVTAVGSYFLDGTEQYVYTDTVTFPGAGRYNVWWINCCRNGAIVNMANPLSESMYLTTIVTVTTSNSTPVFLNAPITLAKVHQLWNYNPLPYDADGDSMAWHLMVPLSTNDSTPVAGYTTPAADSAQPFTLDSITGEIAWQPSLIGNWVSSYLIVEFRAGVKIGEIRRDMQVITLPDTIGNRIAFNTNNWPIDYYGHYHFFLTENAPFDLTIIGSDDKSNYLYATAVGEPFLKSNPATFTTSPGFGKVTSDFSWTPNHDQVRSKFYEIAVRGYEQRNKLVFPQDLTILFTVEAAKTGIAQASQNTFDKIYPNPASNSIYIPYTLVNNAYVQIEVRNILGQTVMVLADKDVVAGQHLIVTNGSDLPNGVYLVTFTINGKEENTQKLTIVK